MLIENEGYQFISERVKVLRNQGIEDNRKIAKMLGIPHKSAGQATHRLIKKGEIAPFGSLKSDDIEEEVKPPGTYERVEELRNQGFDNRQLAQKLGISAHTAAAYSSQLIKAGRIRPFRTRTTKVG